MNKLLIIIILSLSVSCAHRLTTKLPDINQETNRSKALEFDKYYMSHQGYTDTIFDKINIKDKKYDLSTSDYLINFVNPSIYPKLATSSWGKYLGYLSLIPLYFFLDKTLSGKSSFANITLTTLSFGGVAWGLNIEQEKNNKLIDKYNHDLKIKLNIINLPLN